MIGTLLTYLTAIAGIILLFCSWVWVQNRWRESFPDPLADPDVLASRKDCHGCAMHAGPCAERSGAVDCAMRPVIERRSRALSSKHEEIS
ncbi:MAG: hypothetical protein HKN20_00265 [Gemmatimonadetes bacterium]|nr:hypothetical protein [Gemmatimonadota bacterium]